MTSMQQNKTANRSHVVSPNHSLQLLQNVSRVSYKLVNNPVQHYSLTLLLCGYVVTADE